MNLDLVVTGFVLFFTLWGFFTGAARQIAQYVALLVAFLLAPHIGQFAGALVASRVGASLTVGQVLATGISFLILFFAVRMAVTALVRRFLGSDSARSGMSDRLLGAVLSGGRMAVLAYFALCALVFLENSLTLFGKKLVVSKSQSNLLQFVRENNVLQWQQFSGAKEFVKLVQMKADPSQFAKMKDKADFLALMKEQRFTRALSADGLDLATQAGQYKALLQNNDVVELIQDDVLMRRIERLTGASLQ